MKKKALNLVLILTSLIGYLEWGGSNSMFLFQGEMQVISSFISDPNSMIHPLTLLPLVGQILLGITLFQRDAGKILSFIGMGCIGILLLLMFVIGIMNLNYKIIISTIPFLATSIYVIINHRRSKAGDQNNED
jgi:hypothetical protein